MSEDTDRIRVRCTYCGENWETWGTLTHDGAVFEVERLEDGLRCPDCGAASPVLVEVNGQDIGDVRREP